MSDQQVTVQPVGAKPDTYFEARPWQGGFNHAWTRNTKGQFPDLIAYLKSVVFNLDTFNPKFIILHNTGAPTLEGWMNTKGGQVQRQKNLEYYYKVQQGWSSAPHFFVSKDMILEGTPITRMGTHSPSWNDEAIGIEMAGDYDTEKFNLNVRANTCYLMAALFKLLGSRPDQYRFGESGLHFHKEDPNTTHKRCPGKNVQKEDVVSHTLSKMEKVKAIQMIEAINILGDSHVIGADGKSDVGPASMEAKLKAEALTADAALPSLTSLLGSRVLRVGSQGPAVLLCQKILRQCGYRLNLTGYYGLSSNAAIKDFQTKKKLPVDGEVGHDTAQALDDALRPRPNPVDPPKPPPPAPEGGWKQLEIPFPKIG